MPRIIMNIPAHDPTPIYPKTYKAVSEECDKLSDMLTKWRMMTTGHPFKIRMYDGREINYQGVKFVGSPQEVYWGGFFEPFLKNDSIEILQQTAVTAKNCSCDLTQCLDEAEKILAVMVKRFYEMMADTDQILAGNGLAKGGRRDVSSRIAGMSDYISQHRGVIELEYSPKEETVKDVRWEDTFEAKPGILGFNVDLKMIGKKIRSVIVKRRNKQKLI